MHFVSLVYHNGTKGLLRKVRGRHVRVEELSGLRERVGWLELRGW